jgi:hypothetical protein
MYRTNVLCDAVKDYLETFNIYYNDRGVEIVTGVGHEVLVASNWLGELNNGGFTIELIKRCSDFSQFIYAFNIQTAKDCDVICSMDLLNLYLKGEGEVYCSIDCQGNDFEMSYRKVGVFLWGNGGG